MQKINWRRVIARTILATLTVFGLWVFGIVIRAMIVDSTVLIACLIPLGLFGSIYLITWAIMNA